MKKYLSTFVFILLSLIFIRTSVARDNFKGAPTTHPNPLHCKDKDGDGFYVQPKFCGIPDCNDKDPNVKPLTDGAVINEDFISCGNSVELTSSIVINEGAMLDCNQSNLIDIADVFSGIEVLGSNITIKNCDLDGFRMGIYDNYESNQNTYENNRFENIEHTSIYLNHNFNSLVTQNTINNSRNGISIDHSDFNTIEYNIVNDAESYGIYTYYANNNNIIGNEISNSGWNEGYTYRSGISLGYVNQNNLIEGNILRNNDVYNIQLRGRLPEEVPVNNTIINNIIYGTDIFDISEGNNTYCVDGEDNYYFDGALGPICE